MFNFPPLLWSFNVSKLQSDKMKPSQSEFQCAPKLKDNGMMWHFYSPATVMNVCERSEEVGGLLLKQRVISVQLSGNNGP